MQQVQGARCIACRQNVLFASLVSCQRGAEVVAKIVFGQFGSADLFWGGQIVGNVQESCVVGKGEMEAK